MSSKSQVARLPWTHLHAFSYVIIMAAYALMFLLLAPGELADTIHTFWADSAKYEHGWPMVYLARWENYPGAIIGEHSKSAPPRLNRRACAGIKRLAVLNRLKYLNLDGTRVTDGGVAALRKLLPDCQISASNQAEGDTPDIP